MSTSKNAMISTVVRKWLVGLSGLALVGFLLAHLAGNLLIFRSNEAINAYSNLLHTNPALPLLEIGLLVAFLVHIVLVVGFVLESRAARGPDDYQRLQSKRPGGMFDLTTAKAMAVMGILLLIFLVVHLLDFRAKRAEHHDVGAALFAELGDPLHATLYTIGSLLVGWHVYRGFQSAFRSVGFYHERYSPWLAKLGIFLSILIGLGFAAIPLWIFAAKGG